MNIFYLLRSPCPYTLVLHFWILSCLSLCTVHLKCIGWHVYVYIWTFASSQPHCSTLLTLNAVLHTEHVTAVASSNNPPKGAMTPCTTAELNGAHCDPASGTRFSSTNQSSYHDVLAPVYHHTPPVACFFGKLELCSFFCLFVYTVYLSPQNV